LNRDDLQDIIQSPSLRPTTAEMPAFELKLNIDAEQAARIHQWSRSNLVPDPHGDPALNGAYTTTTLYFDTPELDVYHRSDAYRRSKYRIRRYGLMSSVFLERKTKTGDRVRKQRITVAEADLNALGKPPSQSTWDGQWFHDRIINKGLHPSCLISYRRQAWIGSCPEGPLRLTVDSDIQGILCNEFRLVPFDGGLPLLPGRLIAELKFIHALPLPFKMLLNELRINPGPVSKYRLCREAWGLPRSLQGAARA